MENVWRPFRRYMRWAVRKKWRYYRPITITELAGVDLTGYQIMVKLDEANFDFSKSNGIDIRFTPEGKTPDEEVLPHWVENFDTVNKIAKIWVKVPEVPANGSVVIWMYYGNPSAEDISDGSGVFEKFSDFTKTETYYDIYAPNAPSPAIDFEKFYAENIEYDPETGKYWWVFADRSVNPNRIKLAYADSINGPWTIDDTFELSSGVTDHHYDSPCLKKFGDYWYIYYEHEWSGDMRIFAVKSTSVNSGYGTEFEILAPSESYDAYRTGEPYVFYNPQDGKYYLFYMGMPGAGGPEWTCYATSDSPEGPFTKYEGNPVIGVGDNWNGGGVISADPYVFEKDGEFYIGFAGNAKGMGLGAPWKTGFYKTTDFKTFVKVSANPVLDVGESEAWDENAAWRGAVTKIGDTYYLAYAGKGYGVDARGGITILQFNVSLNRLNGEEYATYGKHSLSDSVLYVDKWRNRVGTYETYGVGYALRARAKMVGDTSKKGVIAFRYIHSALMNSGTLEFLSNYDTPYKISVYQMNTEWSHVADVADADEWLVFEIRRLSDGSGKYMINDVQVAHITDQLVTQERNAVFSYSYVDWFAIRKYVDPEPSVSVGNEERA